MQEVRNKRCILQLTTLLPAKQFDPGVLIARISFKLGRAKFFPYPARQHFAIVDGPGNGQTQTTSWVLAKLRAFHI